MKSFTFILGTWAPNIGNSFFQLGGYNMLNHMFPDARFTIIAEQPGYPSYWNPKGGNPPNFFDMSAAVNSDYLVLMGPMFRSETEKVWGQSLEKVLSKGTKLVILGAAAMKYDAENVKRYRKFLEKYPPYLMTTRDTDTYEMLGGLAQYAYDGIDFAFFTPDFYQLGGLTNLPPYVAINFDKVPEPSIKIYRKKNDIPSKEQNNVMFDFCGETWVVEKQNWRTRLAKRSRYLMVVEGFLFPGQQTRQIGSYYVVRTDHRSNPIFPRKTFRYPNTMVNDTPYPYFEIYGNAALTLSNRLHACVIALSYGKPAMLFSESPRIRLLERLNLVDITKHPVILDQKLLEKEKNSLIDFIQKHL